ncbi:MAG: ABC transporter permease [Bacillota bacterium]|nr:ABC transporter permease [Bacillota bacterium]
MSENGKKKIKALGYFHSADFLSYSSIILFIIILSLVLGIVTPNHSFMTQSNILNVIRQVAVYGMLAVGMAFVMIHGGIDLSVGSTAGLCGAVSCLLVVNDIAGVIPSMVVSILLGALIGLFNGLVIAYTGIPPFVATLGTQITVRGFAYIVCNGKPIGNLPESLKGLGVNRFLGIPIPILFMLAMFIIGGIILDKTALGRSFYAVGGNQTAARLAGVDINKVKVLAYTLCGIMAGLAGLILACRNASAQPTAGNTFETEAIAGNAMGGVAFTGGSGTIAGVFFGIFLMGIINNGMNLLGINSYWQYVVKGLIIIASVVYSMNSNKFKNRKRKKTKNQVSGNQAVPIQ